MVVSRGGVEDASLEAKAKHTQKKSEAKAKDSPCEDRPSRGEEQKCRCQGQGPKDTGASVLQKTKVLKIFFQAISKK